MSQKLLTLNVVDCPEEYIGPKQIEMPEVGGPIGRGPGCTFHLADHNKYISGTHALVTTYNGGFYISDVSTNGTFINGQKVLKNQPVGLHDGDRIMMGRYELSVGIENKTLHTDIAADIMPELNTNDPVASLDITLPAKLDEDDGRLEDLFIELEGEEVDTDDPLAHLRFSARDDNSLIESEDFEEPATQTVFQRQIQDDTESIFSEMDVPNLIPENWMENSDTNSTDRSCQIKDISSLNEQAKEIDSAEQKSLETLEQKWEETTEKEVEQLVPDTMTSNCNKDASLMSSTLKVDVRQQVVAERHLSNEDVSSVGYATPDDGIRAFMRGLGLTSDDISLTSSDWYEQLGKCLRLCMDTLSADLHDATSFIKDETCHVESTGSLLVSMSELYKQGVLAPIELLEQAVEEINRHQETMKLASSSLAFEQSSLCDPVGFEKHMNENVIFLSKSKLWKAYQEHYQANARALVDKNETYFNKRLKEQYIKIAKEENA